MGLLDALIFGYRQVLDGANALLPQRSRVKFLGTVTDNPANDSTDVTMGGGADTDAVVAGTGVVTQPSATAAQSLVGGDSATDNGTADRSVVLGPTASCRSADSVCVSSRSTIGT